MIILYLEKPRICQNDKKKIIFTAFVGVKQLDHKIINNVKFPVLPIASPGFSRPLFN